MIRHCVLTAILCVAISTVVGCGDEPTLRTVDQTTEQGLLAQIALEAEGMSVRQAAVLKLTDQTALAKIAVEDEDLYVRQAAQDRLRALQDAKTPE